jgi:hypothetical protein
MTLSCQVGSLALQPVVLDLSNKLIAESLSVRQTHLMALLAALLLNREPIGPPVYGSDFANSHPSAPAVPGLAKY